MISHDKTLLPGAVKEERRAVKPSLKPRSKLVVLTHGSGEQETKSCSKCGPRPVSEFYKCKGNKTGLQSMCKSCGNVSSNLWKLANPDQTSLMKSKSHFKNSRSDRNRMLKLAYGITQDRYEEILKSQNYKCAVCGRDNSGTTRAFNLSVDHNHVTGEIRGLLCHPCNSASGLLFVDEKGIEVVEKLKQYVLRTQK